MKRLALAVLLLAASACGHKKPEKPAYEVFKGPKKVLIVRPGPGVLSSMALPDPNKPPVLHPFLWAASLDPREEDALRAILDRSKSFDEYLANLKAAGYEVKPKS